MMKTREEISIMSVRGRSRTSPVGIPPDDQPYECPVCGIDLEQEDFMLAQQRGWS